MPTREEVVEEVKRVIYATLRIDPDSIRPSSTLRGELHVKSLDLVEVVFELEQKYEMRIRDDAFLTLNAGSTFDQAIDVIYEAVQRAHEEAARKHNTAF